MKSGKHKKWNAGMPVGTRMADSTMNRGFDYYIGFHHEPLVENTTWWPKNEVLDFLSQSVEK